MLEGVDGGFMTCNVFLAGNSEVSLELQGLTAELITYIVCECDAPECFFLVLWWWWVIILVLSSLGLFYRLAQLVVPQLGRYVPDKYSSYNPRHDSLNLRKLCCQSPKYVCVMKNILSSSNLLTDPLWPGLFYKQPRN